MILFLLCLLVVSVIGVRFRKDTTDILCPKDTIIINGFFVVLIFLSHSTQYIELSSSMMDQLYRKVQLAHNQWVVTTFLAFSGYGVMYKLRTTKNYLQTYPVNRILKTLLNFDIAVVLYLIVDFFLNETYPLKDIIGSFFGLTSIGNSNWYIFTILLMYIMTYLAAQISKGKIRNVALIISICSIAFIIIGNLTGLPSRFYSTVCCYPLGMWVELYREKYLFSL